MSAQLWIQFTNMEHGENFVKNTLDNPRWKKQSGRKTIPWEAKKEYVLVFTGFANEEEVHEFEMYIRRDLDVTHIKECRITYAVEVQIDSYVDIDRIAEDKHSRRGGYDPSFDFFYDVVLEGPLAFFGKQTTIYPHGLCRVTSNEKPCSAAYNTELERFKSAIEPYRYMDRN